MQEGSVDTPEVREALDFLEPHIQPEWLIPQFRAHLQPSAPGVEVDREGQHQVFRATFPGIRNSVHDLIGKQMDALARQFVATHDMKIKVEIDRVSSELVKLDRPWVFVAR